MSYLELVLSTLPPALLGTSPIILAWIVGIILAVRMLRRGGERSEKLLLIGCSLMLAAQIVRPFLTGLTLWLVSQGGMTRAASIGLVVSLPLSILNMAGIVCLIVAFWMRWRTKSTATQ
ncbi:hypothetical protein ACFLVA_01865 [Chloroflexota bacterium]